VEKIAEIILRPEIYSSQHVFRGFENVRKLRGFLWAVLGGVDPGRSLGTKGI